MKHPALTRLFAVVLAVLCLTMLLAGLGSAGGAISGLRSGQAEVDRLNKRIEEYREILQQSEGAEPYALLRTDLEEEQAQHDADASQHRTELAIYTATRGGLQTGAAALDQAEAALATGKAQYEQGRALFEAKEKQFWDGYQQFQEGKRQLEEGRKLLELAASALAGLRAQVNQGRQLAAILESGEEDARQQLTVAAYDSLLQTLDQATALYDALKDQGGINPEQLQAILTLLSKQTGADLSGLLDGLSWDGISAESLQELENRVYEATGMSVAEIRAQIQEQRDAVAGLDGETPLTEEQFAALQAAYSQSREWIQAVLTAMEQKLDEYEVKLQEARAQMDAAQEQIDALNDYMEQGKAAMVQARAGLDMAGEQIKQGEQGIAQARQELQKKEAELAEKAEQLRQEKLELDAEAVALEAKTDRANARKELEQREASVRLMLLDREEICARVDGGMELLPAAEEYAAERLAEVRRTAAGRLWISALMLLGAVAGFADIPAAFEKTKSRFRLIAPVALCFACAVGVEALCRSLGRGDSYSALAVAVFAAIQLLLVIPQKKKA